jgi:hypothetical protein
MDVAELDLVTSGSFRFRASAMALNDSFATVDRGTKAKLTEERPRLLPGVDQLESFGSLE